MFFQVDMERCLKDEICVLECPARILEMGDGGPFMGKGGIEVCIRCGHCVAVCPVAAVSLDFLAPQDCLSPEDSEVIDWRQAEVFLRSRRSIRTYRKKPLARDVMEKALAVAAMAPTGSNRQLVQWLVMEKREDVEKVAGHVVDWMRYLVANKPEVAAHLNMSRIVEGWDQGLDRICRHAPHLIFAYTHKDVDVWGADCHTALAYLELFLPTVGGGSCWAGYVTFAAGQWPPLAEFLGLGNEHVVRGAVMAGMPKFGYQRIPPRNPPKVIFR